MTGPREIRDVMTTEVVHVSPETPLTAEMETLRVCTRCGQADTRTPWPPPEAASAQAVTVDASWACPECLWPEYEVGHRDGSAPTADFDPSSSDDRAARSSVTTWLVARIYQAAMAHRGRRDADGRSS